MASPESLARRAVRALRPYRAGTTEDEARRRYGLARVIKLSSNENPLGPSPRAVAALADVGPLNLYVNDELPEVRDRLAARAGVSRESIVCGHGSNDVLMTLYATFVDAGDEIVSAQPTFSLFPKYAALFDAQVVAVPLREGVHDLDAMLAAVTPRTKMVVVVDPNNPTGTAIEPAAFRLFAAALPEHVMLVVDQAYREYMPPGTLDAGPYATSRPNTIVTRTMSKVYGLASMRFGYAVTSTEIAGMMQRVRTPFNVSRPAAVAALAALDDDAFLARSIRLNDEGKTYLAGEFSRLGLRALPTAANFHALEVPVDADRAYTDLMQHGIIVRSGDGLGLSGHLRITIGTREENEALIGALDALVEGWRGRRETVLT